MSMTPAAIAARLANDVAGITTFADLSGGTSKLKIKALLDLVSAQQLGSGSGPHRGHLDQMSPAAHRQLVAELTALYNIVAN